MIADRVSRQEWARHPNGCRGQSRSAPKPGITVARRSLDHQENRLPPERVRDRTTTMPRPGTGKTRHSSVLRHQARTRFLKDSRQPRSLLRKVETGDRSPEVVQSSTCFSPSHHLVRSSLENRTRVSEKNRISASKRGAEPRKTASSVSSLSSCFDGSSPSYLRISRSPCRAANLEPTSQADDITGLQAPHQKRRVFLDDH